MIVTHLFHLDGSPYVDGLLLIIEVLFEPLEVVSPGRERCGRTASPALEPGLAVNSLIAVNGACHGGVERWQGKGGWRRV